MTDNNDNNNGVSRHGSLIDEINKFDELGKEYRKAHKAFSEDEQQTLSDPDISVPEERDADVFFGNGEMGDTDLFFGKGERGSVATSADKPESDNPAEIDSPGDNSLQGVSDSFEPLMRSVKPTEATEDAVETDKTGEMDNMTRRANARREKKSGQLKDDKMTNSRKNSSGKNGRKGKKKNSGKRIAMWTLLILIVLVIIMGIVALVYAYSVIKSTPKYDTNDIEKRLKVMSTIYDDEGNVVKNIYLDDGQRTLVKFEQIPENAINALIAIEDKTFWKHNGFNFVRMMGAVRDTIFKGKRIGGTSTITQQLARNLWLSDIKSKRSIDRKIKEAYYAYELEKNLSKKEIITAYLNTIAYGNHSYGISAAARSYFNKNVEDLDLIESAALAALPNATSRLSLIKTVSPETVAEDDERILLRGTQYCYLYNDAIEPRVKLVLSSMLEQELITQAEYDEAMAQNMREHVQPTELQGDSNAAFFVSYAINNVADKLMELYPEIGTKDEALQMVYSGGLEIHSTLSTRIQNIMSEQYANPKNFPGITGIRYDGAKNIIDDAGNPMLFNAANVFGEGNVFVFSDGEYDVLENGNLIFYKAPGSRIGYYRTNSAAGEVIQVEFKSFYTRPDGVLYMTNGGIINVPSNYMTMDELGNMILSKEYFADESIASKWNIDENNAVWFGPECYSLRQSVIQPQSASVVIDHHTGQVKGMIGGRNVTGEMNYNRAINPRQPGSAMKPIGTYGPAIEMGANKEPVKGDAVTTYGTFWTAASIIIDEETIYNGKVWPKNWYAGYKGPQTLRRSIEQSINVNAVKVQVNIGTRHSVDFLNKLGISTLVEKPEYEGGPDDMNPSALALGGMTKGVTPLDITSAYGAFANEGIHIKPITYTSVTDKMGNVVLDGTPQSAQAMNPGTAFIMNDILRTTVTQGIASDAAISGVPVAGKTGTTSDNFDIWFVGNTPKYSCGIWIGNDVNIELNATSNDVARLFSRIMSNVVQGDPQGSFPAAPANVGSQTVDGLTDYFISGTAPEKLDFGNEEVAICTESGDKATPWCPLPEARTFNSLNLNSGEEVQKAPEYFCNLHNLDALAYPYDPAKPLDTTFDPNKKKEDEESAIVPPGGTEGGGSITAPSVLSVLPWNLGYKPFGMQFAINSFSGYFTKSKAPYLNGIVRYPIPYNGSFGFRSYPVGSSNGVYLNNGYKYGQPELF